MAARFSSSRPWGDVNGALTEVAKERGWDLSNIDTTALKAEIGKLS
jgi:hypothetical protein